MMNLDRWLDWMGTRRGWAMSLCAAALLAAAWTARSAAAPASTTAGRIPSPRQGFLAPSFELPTAGADVVRLTDLRGKVVVINFWASWCPPCQAEMPALERVYEAGAADGLVVLGINATFEDDAAQAATFAQSRSVSFPILLDRAGQVNHLYQVRALPTTFVIDRTGTIQQVIIGGPLLESSLRSLVQALLQAEP